jgi:uncharacterized protein YeaO (DUF488 family)
MVRDPATKSTNGSFTVEAHAAESNTMRLTTRHQGGPSADATNHAAGAGAAQPFELRRIYDVAPDRGGYRVLVDRLWPRGVSKDRARLDEWARDLAPETELRRWYGHDPVKFQEFARRYLGDLRREPARGAAKKLRALAGDRQVILLTATRDIDHSAARVLYEFLARSS